MSLKNIHLPPIVLQQLFKHSLVVLSHSPLPGEKPSAKELVTLGNNLQQILIIVSNDETVYLPDEELNFLMGILAACNLTMEDVAILNIKKNENATYKTINKELSSRKLILFGVTPDQIDLPLKFPDYQIQRYNNQVYLTAPPLSCFKDDKMEKTKLWNCLKQIFEI